MTALAATIKQLDPDVLALQEIGGPTPFAELQAELGNYPHKVLASATEPAHDIRVGFLSKHKIKSTAELGGFSSFPAETVTVTGTVGAGAPTTYTAMGRTAVRISITVGSTDVQLINTHLKSKLISYPSAPGKSRFSPKDENERSQGGAFALLKRTAEATAMRVYLNSIIADGSQDAVILLGDCNDGPDAATSELLVGPLGSELGTRGAQTPDKGDMARMFNLAPLIRSDRRYSRIFRGRQELIDLVFATRKLVDLGPTVDSHIDWATLTNKAGGMPSISANPNTRRDKPASDHAPVTATFSRL